MVCSSEGARCFGGTYRLHRLGKPLEAIARFCWLLPWFALESRRCKGHASEKSKLSSKYLAFQLRIPHSSQSPPWEPQIRYMKLLICSFFPPSVLLLPLLLSKYCPEQRSTCTIFHIHIHITCESQSYFIYTKSAMLQAY
jgi:hypothetical protein